MAGINTYRTSPPAGRYVDIPRPKATLPIPSRQSPSGYHTFFSSPSSSPCHLSFFYPLFHNRIPHSTSKQASKEVRKQQLNPLPSPPHPYSTEATPTLPYESSVAPSINPLINHHQAPLRIGQTTYTIEVLYTVPYHFVYNNKSTPAPPLSLVR